MKGSLYAEQLIIERRIFFSLSMVEYINFAFSKEKSIHRLKYVQMFKL